MWENSKSIVIYVLRREVNFLGHFFKTKNLSNFVFHCDGIDSKFNQEWPNIVYFSGWVIFYILAPIMPLFQNCLRRTQVGKHCTNGDWKIAIISRDNLKISRLFLANCDLENYHSQFLNFMNISTQLRLPLGWFESCTDLYVKGFEKLKLVIYWNLLWIASFEKFLNNFNR